jgi:hypothetical protein
MRLLNIKEALQLTSPEAIQGEVEVRRALIRNMVGWLYPRMLNDEIVKLLDRKAAILEEMSKGSGAKIAE